MNKALKVIIISIVVILAIILGIYIIQKLAPFASNVTTDIKNNLPKSGTDDFSIYVPKGWTEVKTLPGISLMAVNNKEESADPAAKKINFRTYLAVSYDTLNNRTLSEYIQYIKNSLEQTAPDAVYSNERSGKINDKDAYFIEADVYQQGVNVKALLVFILGKDKDIWTISLNTTKLEWDTYSDLFSQIANSFEVK